MRGQFNYVTTNGTITITGYTGPGGAVSIPSQINGLPVTSIGWYAFHRCASLTSITIPNSVTTIGEAAFANCISLATIDADPANPSYSSVDGVLFNKTQTLLVQCPGGRTGAYTFPGSVITIGDYAFSSCRSLTSITIPNSVTTIGWRAFDSCFSLTSVTIPNSVTTIGTYAFTECRSVTNLTIGNGTTTIETYAFHRCTSLTSVTIPKSVTSIGDWPFSQCSSLTTIDVDPANPSYSSMDGVLFNKSRSWLFQYPGGKTGAYVLPNSVTSISDYAFAHCTSLTSVTIPKSVTNIRDGTFYGCSSLTNVIVGNSVTTIGWQAFSNCSSLTTITIPNGVTVIGDAAFSWCTNLTSVTIPNSVTTIGAEAFRNCTSLTSVTLGNSVTFIGNAAFSWCTSLRDICFQGNAPGLGGASVFANDVSATVYYLPLTTGWGSTFGFRPTVQLYDCTTGGGAVTITKYNGPGGNVTIISQINGLPVATIGEGAFRECTSLTSITIPNSVTTIGDWAFSSCNNLTAIQVDPANPSYSSVDGVLFNKSNTLLLQCPGGKTGTYAIPNSVTNIASGAFDTCTRLTSILIPNSVTTIGDSAFSSCNNLTAIQVDPANPSYSSVDGVLFNKTQTRLIQFPAGEAGTYAIPNSVTDIGDAAFAGCTKLTSVDIGAGVTGIGRWAFESCTSLTNLTIPDNVRSIGLLAFRFCLTLTNVSIGNGIVTISEGMFRSCWRLTSVSIPNSVTSIGGEAFGECQDLASITIPGSVTSMDDGVFTACLGLKAVYFYGNAPSIGSGVFEGANSVTVYHLPETTGWGSTFGGRPVRFWSTEVPCAFSINESLITITAYIGSGGALNIPNTISGFPVTTIGAEAFRNCTNLTSVTIPYSVTTIGNNAFLNCTSLTAIQVDSANPSYSSVDGVLFNKSNTLLLQCPGGKTGTYAIPNSVTNIASGAFDTCTRLTSITIPDSVTTIGERAFAGCESLTSIVIPDRVTTIEREVFCGCASLTTITIPSSVISIGDWTFMDCHSLARITIPGSVTNIGEGAFFECWRLHGVCFEGNAPSIGRETFSSGWTTLFYAPGTTGWSNPFGDCVTGFWDPATRLAYLTDGLTANLANYFGSDDTLTIPGTINGLPVTTIASAAFERCTSLTSVTIPNGVTSIGNGAFEGCTSLTSVTIPDSVVWIENFAFAYCTNLTSVYFEGNAPGVDWELFYETLNTIIYYLPGTIGWGPTYADRPTSPWFLPYPVVLTTGSPTFGLKTNGFGFTVSWATIVPVTVEACTNLSSPTWSPVQTLALTNGSALFTDPTYTNYPSRFYRVRWP